MRNARYLAEVMEYIEPHQTVTIQISEDGKRAWFCDSEGTFGRIKCAGIILDDRRLTPDDESD